MTTRAPEVDLGWPDDSVEGWVEAGWSMPVRLNWITHEGIRLCLREWGTPGMPGVVLVHGGAAHSRWWDHIAPRLAAERHVIAMDLSGHGDSDRRSVGYSVAEWSREVLAVAELASAAGPPALIGHSMGGVIATRATLESDAKLAGLIIVDTALRHIGEVEVERRRNRAGRVANFASEQSAVEAFRTLPAGGDHRHISMILRHVAETSVRRTAEGWTWKVDRRAFLRDSFTAEEIQPLDFPALVVAAEHGLLSGDRAAFITEQLGELASTVTIPSAGHHLMLDQPVALTTCLDTALATWQVVRA